MGQSRDACCLQRFCWSGVGEQGVSEILDDDANEHAMRARTFVVDARAVESDEAREDGGKVLHRAMEHEIHDDGQEDHNHRVSSFDVLHHSFVQRRVLLILVVLFPIASRPSSIFTTL